MGIEYWGSLALYSLIRNPMAADKHGASPPAVRIAILGGLGPFLGELELCCVAFFFVDFAAPVDGGKSSYV